jgi:DNA mismatch endonuclease, patch repair protein
MSSIRSRAPLAASALVRRVMQSNTQTETAPEKLIRGALHRVGLRFRKDARPDSSVRCTADAVFSRAKVCVFVDGCFWHGCPIHFRCPKTNSTWWQEKIEDNKIRDNRQADALRDLGWLVIRIWEHHIQPQLLDAVVSMVKIRISNRTSTR